MKRPYFITATGTGLGKTWMTAGVCALCRDRNIPARALKPVMSGYDPEHPETSDAWMLLGKFGADVTATVESISPWRFAAPLSPDRAAVMEGKDIDFSALIDWCRAEIHRNEGLLLIEGIGGTMVPLGASHTVRDWIVALDIPVVLVVGSYLGALSHTLTALAALREAGVVPAAIIVNASAGSTVTLDDTEASLRPHIGAIPLLIIGRDDTAGLARVADLLLE